MKTRNTNLLINALQASFDNKDNHGFNKLSKLAKRHESLFRSKPRYWLLQASYAQRNKHYRTALRYYKKLLKLKPKSKEAIKGIKAIKRASLMLDLQNIASLK